MTNFFNQTRIQAHQFREAVRFLRKTKISDQPIYHHPWVLVLGTEKAGITSMIQHGETHFYLARKLKNDTHNNPNWWVSPHAVFLDVPHCYLEPGHQTDWTQFIKLIKKYAPDNRPNSIVIVTSISDLLQHDEQQYIALFQKIKHLLHSTSQTTPIYWAISQCDLLPGFETFFSHLSKEDRQGAFGFDIQASNHISLNELLNTEFAQLTQTLQQQLLFRLHHEPEIDNRHLMKKFIEEFKRVPQSLNAIFNVFEKILPKAKLHGVYFTSSKQPLFKQGQIKLWDQDTSAMPTRSRAYFIHQLLKEIVTRKTTKQKIKQNSKKRLLRYAAIPICFGAFSIFFILLINNFKENIFSYRQADYLLSHFTHFHSSTPEKINVLEKTLIQKQPIWSRILPEENNTSKTNQQLEKKLTGLLTKQLHVLFNNALADSNVSLPWRYKILTAYLMLEKTKHFDSTVFDPVIQTLWKAQNISIEPNSFISALHHEIRHNHLQFVVDKKLVAQNRELLNSLNPLQLSLTIAESYFLPETHQTIRFSNDDSAQNVFHFKNPDITINSFFTKTTEKQLHDNGFAAAANIVIKGNWVLGNASSHPIINSHQLINMTKKAYENAYTKNWQQFLSNIELQTPTQYSDLKHLLNVLSNSNSPLTDLINFIQLNSLPDSNSPFSDMKEFNKQLLPLIAAINQQLSQQENDQLLWKLAQNRLLNKKQNNLTQLVTFAQSAPEPLRTLLGQLELVIWKNILEGAQSEINTAWNKNVFTSFKSHLMNRFPFDHQSNNPISINSFIDFFGESGVLNNFTENQLKGFIDTNHMPWRTVSLDGVGVNISNQNLNSLMNASKLQATFFPNHNDNLFIPFSISLVNSSNNIQNIHVALGKQAITLTKSDRMPHTLRWPDVENKLTASLMLQTSTGNINQTVENPWGLWQLFSNGQWSNMTNQTAVWTYKNEDNAFALKITFDTPENPLDSKIFHGIAFTSEL